MVISSYVRAEPVEFFSCVCTSTYIKQNIVPNTAVGGT